MKFLVLEDDVLRRRGDLVAAVRPSTVVEVVDGAVRPGPFARGRVPLAGFGVVEARDLEEAIALVSKTPCPNAKGAVEVWPVWVP